MNRTARRSSTALSFAPALLLGAALAGAPGHAATVLHAHRLLDVRAGTIVPDAALVVEGDRIAYAGPARGRAPAADDTVLELGDVTLLPGLMDLHTHLRARHEITAAFGHQSIPPRGVALPAA